MVVAASSHGCCFSVARKGRLVTIEGRINAAKYNEVIEANLLQIAHDLRLNNPKHFGTSL